MLMRMQRERPGLLVAFDGVDSSGKETQVARLRERLVRSGFSVRSFASPDYTTSSGKQLKARLQNKRGPWRDWPWENKMRLFASNRREHKAEVEAALHQGEVVLYDRYVPSSLAFMTVEALDTGQVDLFREQVQRAVSHHEYDVNGMPHEHVSMFLDVPPLISQALLAGRKHQRSDDDEYTDHLAVQQRLYNEYDLLCTNDPRRFVRIRAVVGQQLLGIDDVAALVWEELRQRFPFLATYYAKT